MARKNKPARNRAASDSHPATFTEVDLRELLDRPDRHLDYSYPLDTLSVDQIRSSLQEANRGAYARIQWIYENLEPADAYLATCVERRESALSRIPHRFVKLEGLSDIEDSLADSQLRTIQDFANNITNLKDAIIALGQASFRAYKRLQMLETSQGFELVETQNWNWVREGYNGDWQWNPRANYGTNKGIDSPVTEDHIITRLNGRPIDQVAMMLCLDRKNAKAQWMVYNGRYGVPPIYIVMPPNTDPRTKSEYLRYAKQCISNASGVLPQGAEIKTVAVQQSSPETFKGINDMCREEIVLRATGGLLTMLTAPGAGTNTTTGNAHQEAFDELAAKEASDIADLLNQTVFWPLIEQYHPGQPCLVDLEIKHPESRDTQARVADVAQLSAAGFRLNPRQIEELTGYEILDISPAASRLFPSVSANAGPARIRQLNTAWRRYAPTIRWPEARRVFDQSIQAKIKAALARLTAAPDPLQTAELAKSLETPLYGEIKAAMAANPSGALPPVANPLQTPNLTR